MRDFLFQRSNFHPHKGDVGVDATAHKSTLNYLSQTEKDGMDTLLEMIDDEIKLSTVLPRNCKALLDLLNIQVVLSSRKSKQTNL